MEFKVQITKEGSEKAKPAIWYAWKENKIFTVVRSKEYPSVYEVTKGHYKGMVIDPADCKKI